MVATLSMSGASLHCGSVLRTMAQLGIYGDVTHNLTVNPDGTNEPGCRVLIANSDAEEMARRLWSSMRADNLVDCVHVNIETMKRGCSYDVFAPPRCPTAPRS